LHNTHRVYPVILAFILCAVLSRGALAQSCPNDLYIGYYLEDAVANPEDPLPGAIHLSLPKQNGAFSGELFFTYVGCQSRNIGTLSGQRSGTALSGNWRGTVDNTVQRGSFLGNLNQQGAYSGTYTVDGGKQNIVVEGCIDYFIAPFGTWFLFPIAEDSPDDELIEINDNQIRWTPVSGSSATQCQLIDLDDENCNEATQTLWQDIRLANERTLDIPLSFLVEGRKYAVSCTQFDSNGNSLAYSKTVFDYTRTSIDPNPVPLPPINFLLLEDEAI